MRRSITRLLGTCALLTLTGNALAQDHPNDARGFNPGRLYDVHDLDIVNAFNGNLNITIPIGPEFSVSPVLSYRFSLVYNSHAWRYEVFEPTLPDTQRTVIASPIPDFNAGLGWSVSLGRLLRQDPVNAVPHWTFVAPDGARHSFWPENAFPGYTQDGSYMRLSNDTGTRKIVETPDGTQYKFKQLMPANGPWYESTTGDYYLSEIKDRFENSVTIAYSRTSPSDEKWAVTDGERTSSLFFDVADGVRRIARIELPAPAGGVSTYSFTIDDYAIGSPIGDTCEDPDQCQILVPLLTNISLPSVGTEVAPEYQMTLSNGTHAYSNTRVTAGALTRLRLPTMGAIEWTHELLPQPYGHINNVRSPAIERPFGVVSRRLVMQNGPSSTWVYQRRYSQREECPSLCPPTQPPCSVSRQLTCLVTAPPEMDANGNALPAATTISYFSTYQVDLDSTCNQIGDWGDAEYGLPLTRYEPSSSRHAGLGGGFLSTEVRTGVDLQSLNWNGRGGLPTSGSGTGTLLRSTYITYDTDGVSQWGGGKNPRVQHTTTFFEDDQAGPTTSDPTACAGGCYSSDSHFGWDDRGHFRQTSTNGNFPGSNFRTTFTNYPTSLDSASHWVLNTYDEQCTANVATAGSTLLANGCASLSGALTTRTQFDRSTGALTARRVLSQTATSGTAAPLSTDDTLTIFTYDHGFPASEKHYGGDNQALPTATAFAPPTADPTYWLEYSNAFSAAGSLISRTGGYVRRFESGTQSVLKTLDEAYDVTSGQTSTGLLTTAKDSAGLSTSYAYDARWRLSGISPPAEASTVLHYADAFVDLGGAFHRATANAIRQSAQSPPPEQPSHGQIRGDYDYDEFGRMIREKTLMPNETTSVISTTYDLAGRKTAISSQVASSIATPPKTTFKDFDAFGNAQTITAQDGAQTTLARRGVRRLDRTVHGVHVPGALRDVTTTEVYDRFGQLVSVTEPSGTTAELSPVGANSTTTYGYDVAGHLVSVAMASGGVTQPRSFAYDRRGFLTSETHPELGASGNGSIQYSNFDAKGHPQSKITGTANGVFDLLLAYDEAERLKSISDLTGGVRTPVKVFTYAEANDGTNYKMGRLESAVRVNKVPDVTNVEVKETYAYGASGRVSQRDTLVESVSDASRSTMQKFTQSFSYDDLGDPETLTYPTCDGITCTGGSPIATITSRFHNGMLVKVDDYASSITYHDNGAVNSVIHGTNQGANVADTYGRDANGLPRPASVSFTGWENCVPPSPTISGASAVCANSTGNIASVQSVTGVSYSWSISGGTITGGNGTSSITYTAGSSNVVLTVEASSCASTTVSKTISTSTGPTANVVTGTVWIAPHASTNISVALTGTAPWTITWSDGFVQPDIGQQPATRSVTPSVRKIYSLTAVTDAGGCVSGSVSGSATVSINTPAPTQVIATTQPNTLNTPATSNKVHVQWSQAPDASFYRVERLESIVATSYTSVATTSALSTDDYPPLSATPKTYVYQIRSLDADQNGSDLVSPFDYATTATTLFTDDALVAGQTRIFGVHVQQLRKAIDAVRAAANLSPSVLWSSSYPVPTGTITAVDNTNMRSELNAAASWIVGHTVAYSGTVPAHAGRIYAYQYQDIREGVK